MKPSKSMLLYLHDRSDYYVIGLRHIFVYGLVTLKQAIGQLIKFPLVYLCFPNAEIGM
jgi:hypothetical protein